MKTAHGKSVTSPSPGVNRRRIHLIKKSFQIKAFLFIFLITLCGISLHSFFLVHLMGAARSSASAGSVLTMRIVVQDFLITLVLLVVLDYVMGILGTHLIAGPIFKFQKFMNRMAKGDLSGEVVLRRGDALTDVAEDMNEMLSGLRALVQRDRRLVDDVRQELTQAYPDSGDLPPILAKLERISAAYRLAEEDPIPSAEEVNLSPWV